MSVARKATRQQHDEGRGRRERERRTLGNQTSSTVNSSRVELNKLHILQRQSSSSDHSSSVSGTGVGTSTGVPSSSVTSGGENGLVRSESVHRSIFLVVRHDSDALSILHDQICTAFRQGEGRRETERID